MRLKRENPVIKKEPKNLFKNNTLFEGNQNQKLNYENNYLQNRIKRLNINNQKEKLKDKNLNHLPTNHFINNNNVYKPNKKLFSNRNIKNKLERNNIYLNDIKQISSIINNNINIDNKANLLSNAHHIHIKSENNVKNIDNSLNNKLKNDNIPKNDIDDYSYNTINGIHYNRLDKKMKNRKSKDKNISVELRRRIINRGAMTLDGIDEISDNENPKIGSINNPIYSKIYKSNSSDSNNNNDKYETTIDYRQNILSDRIGEIHNNNKYINEKSQKMIFNNHFNKTNNNYYNINRNHLYFINESNLINEKKEQNKTAKNFYVDRNQISTARNINNNYFNYINSRSNININRNIRNRQHVNSMTIENSNQYSSLDEEHNLTYFNYNRNEGNKTSRRSKNKNKIKINNNSNIVEYNLDISDIIDDTNEYKSEFNNGNPHNKYKIFNNINLKKHNIQKKFFFSKNIRPIITTQFSIEGIKNSFNIINKTNYNTNINILTNDNKANSRKHLISTPKRSNSINGKKINHINNNNCNREGNNNINIEYDNISFNKILFKKRPKNEIPKPLLLNKRKNSSSSFNSNKSNIKFNRILEINKIDNININPNVGNNKLYFSSEKEIVNYINRKYEDEKKKSFFSKKLRYTGFILSKKYKGNNLYDIKIEDDLDKINYQLKEKKVVINNKQVKLIFSDNNNDFSNNGLKEEIKKLKVENEKLIKKEKDQNDLIIKLDKEKQKLMEEIEIMKIKIKESNNIKSKLNKDIDNKINKNILYKIEKNSLFSINNINKSINKENINKNDIIKIQNNNKANYNNRFLDIKKKLFDLINDEKIGENIKAINIKNNIYKKSDNYINDKNELNNDKKILDLIDGILKLNEINKKLNLKDIEDNINISSVNDASINDIEIYNQSHPRINDLVESEMSEKEESK